MEISEISLKTIDVQEYFREWEKTNNRFYPDDMKWDRAKVNKFLSDYKKQLGGTFMRINEIELKLVDNPEEQTRAYVSVMIDNSLFLSNIRLNQVCDKFLFDYPSPGNEFIHCPVSSDFRTYLEQSIITAYKAELKVKKSVLGLKLLNQNFQRNEFPEKDSDPRFTWCDVEGCKANVEFGGTYWKGYWNLCYKHSSMQEEGKPLPKMKEEAIERERMRDKKTKKL